MARKRSYVSTRARKRQSEQQPKNKTILARQPVSLDPGRRSLAQLPDEVLLFVLSFVDNSDLCKVASLSSALYEKARRVQHYKVHINLSQRRQALERLDILARNLLLPAVGVLEVDSDRGRMGAWAQEQEGEEREEGEEGDEILTRLADMLPNMTGLRDINWQVLPDLNDWNWPRTIPRAFLDHVPARARLHTHVGAISTDESHGLARAFLAQLTDNQNLVSLSVNVNFVPLQSWGGAAAGQASEHACRATMRVLKQVLLSCPRLSRIPLLFVGPYIGDYRVCRAGALYCGLGLSGGERPPALEEIGLGRYPWGYVLPPGAPGPPGFYYTEYPEKVRERQYWVETFDWSRLRRLNDFPSSVALDIAPKLTALKEVVVDDERDGRWGEAIAQVPTELELVSITNWSCVGGPGSITRHGAALRKLTIHRKEEPWTADSLVTDADLVALGNGLPHLTELTLDIARDKNENDWPYSSLEAIASIPCLQSVKLWFELGTEFSTPPIPYITVSAAHHLFAYLRERNRNIQRLELCSGAPRGQSPANFGLDSHWAMQNSVRLLCEVSVLDGGAGNGFVRVTCPDLSKEMNAELGRRAKENKEGSRGLAKDATELLLEVALNGPLPLQEWRDWCALTWEWAAQRRKKSAFRRFFSCISKYI